MPRNPRQHIPLASALPPPPYRIPPAPAMVSTPADGAGEPVEAKGKGMEEGEKKKVGEGVLGRMEKGYLSKEEAAVHARMRRRTQFSHRTVRNIIFLSFMAEVVAVGYAIMMTRDEDLTWQVRAIRLLPMFVLPAISSVVYLAVVNFTRMRKYLETPVRIHI